MTSAPTFETFARDRAHVGQLLVQLEQAFRRLDSISRADQIARVRKALESDTFKVLIAGEFKRGKSTLINALLGQNVLPAKVAPCTAVITRIRFGEKKRAVLYFRDDDPEIVSAPLEVDLEANPAALKDLVTIKVDEQDDVDEATGQRRNVSPYSHCEVFYPLELCRQNVEIVDSPGLNESETRTEVTRSFLVDADAMVIVLSCEQQFSSSERSFIENELASRDLSDVFFLWNRFDAVRDSPEDVSDLKRLSREKLEPRVGGRPRVFYVAARDALAGRLQNQEPLLTRSGVPEFERALETFLARERGRVKLRTPIRMGENAVSEGILQLLPYREKLLKQPLEELQLMMEKQRPKLDAVERQRERILHTIERRGDVMVTDAQSSLRSLIRQIDTGLAQRAAAVDVGIWETIRSKQKVEDKVIDSLQKYVDQEVKKWQETVLMEILRAHHTELVTQLDEQAKHFMMSLEEYQQSITATVSLIPERKTQEVSALNRIAGAGLGILGGWGAMIEGASHGADKVVNGVIFNGILGFAMVMMKFTIPVVGITLGAISLGRTIFKAQQAASEIRAAATSALSTALLREQVRLEGVIRQQVLEMITKMRDTMGEQMGVMVDEVRGQLESVIVDRQQQEQTIDEHLNECTLIRSQLETILTSLQGVRAGLEVE